MVNVFYVFIEAPVLWLVLSSMHDIMYYVSFNFKLSVS
jgi:hypothetical protein